MCEAGTDQNMDELSHQRVNATIADQEEVQVAPLSESESVIESSNDGANLGTIEDEDDDGTADDNGAADDDNNCKTLNTDDRCGDTVSTSRSSDDLSHLKTENTSSSRDEETGSTITSDVGGGKCNSSTAPLIGYAARSSPSFDENNFDGGASLGNELDLPSVPNTCNEIQVDPQFSVEFDYSTVKVVYKTDHRGVSVPMATARDRALQEELNETDSPLRPPPSRVESSTVVETEDNITTITGPSSSSDVKQNIEVQNNVAAVERPNAANNPAAAAVERPNVATYMKEKVLEDDGELNARLKKRWGKRKQERRAKNSSPRHQQSGNKLRTTIVKSSNSDILCNYKSGPSSPERYPDDVSFGLEDEEGAVATTYSPPTRTMRTSSYRKCLSDFGPNTYSSPRRRIGILQADGIVYDDALLIRLARQSRPGRHRRKTSATIKGDVVDPMTGEEFPPVLQTNEVKIHVYDLLTKDCMVEMPYLNCNFPIGRCFKAVNDGCNYLGTGAYHVGVEVNGVEYAYGGNNIQGMSGIFTCIPKESPGYDYRDTIDLGKLHTTKRTWIRIPKATNLSPLSQRMSKALVKLTELSDDEKHVESESSQNAYTYREIQTFADGHTVVHEMTSDYLGVDYDLLRKNCCTFAHDACLRLGVNEEDIPSWFRNAALAGAQAEDTLINADNTVKNAFKCREDPLEAEECSTGFEVIAKMERIDGSSTLKSLQVVESSPEHSLRNTLLSGIPLEEIDPEIAMRETASWA